MARTRQQLPQQQAPFPPMGHDWAPMAVRPGGLESNAALQDQMRAAVPDRTQVAQNVPSSRPRPLTPRQRWEQDYQARANRPLDADRINLPRWKAVTDPAELEAIAAQDPRNRPAAGQLGYTTTVNGRTYRYDRVAEDPDNPTLTSQLMGRNPDQFYAHAFVTQRQNPRRSQQPFNDVTILNANGTVTVQRQNEDGMVELPDGGFGFTTYNRNDVRLPGGQPQRDQWGKPQTIANLVNIAADYRTLLPNQDLSYGDIATDTNQSPLLETGRRVRHQTHGQGNQVDLQYPGDRTGQRALVDIAEAHGVNNFYYNPALRGELYFEPGTTATPDSGHRDHLHMGWGPGGP